MKKEKKTVFNAKTFKFCFVFIYEKEKKQDKF